MIHDGWKTIQQHADIIQPESNFDDDNDLSSSEHPEQKNGLKFVKKIVNQYMIRGSGSSMQGILDLRTYGLKIHYNTTAEGTIDGIGDQIVYKHLQFNMPQLREMIHNAIEIVNTQLFHNLMFITNDKNISIISWSTLRDDASNQTRKWNFVQDERNHGSVDEQTWLQNRIGSMKKIQF